MNRRLAVIAAVALLVSAGCGGGSSNVGDGGLQDAHDDYAWSFTCSGRDLFHLCPEGQPCPRVPLGTAGACDGVPLCHVQLNLTESCDHVSELPEGFSADAGYPVGCAVMMPWRGFHSGPQPCYCSSDGGTPAGWVCLM
jgi:hypothetical protein